MSGNYATRLSDYPNKGVVGLPESFDTPRALCNKLKKFTAMIQTSKNTVILTGAGISTAANIPDFRGPNGIWTLEKRRQEETTRKRKNNVTKKDEGTLGAPLELMTNGGKKRKAKGITTMTSMTQQQPPPCIDFSKARPTLTHLAIAKLANDGKIEYVVTQNVDGLHRRAGLSRDLHSTVHGCVFTQKCRNPKCGLEVFTDQEVDSLSFRATGRKCDECGSNMHDILLDWEDMVLDLDLVTKKCEDADLVVCLGTSLRINPIGSLPLLAKRFVIVNLQATPIDDEASLIIRAKVDDVMMELMTWLGYRIEWPDEVPSVEFQWKPANGDNGDFARILTDTKRQAVIIDNGRT
jgi:NAD+-dependent protein deacetylase sirtuin 6